MLYLLLQIPKEVIESGYYEKMLNKYYAITEVKLPIKEKVIHKTIEDYYFNYGFTEGLYQYWLKYYYPTCLNFSSFLAIYSGEELPYTVFENTTTTALNKLSKFIEEQSIDMIRHEMSDIAELAQEEGVNIYFIWKSLHDRKTCKICRDLDERIYTWAPDLAHPNCRCILQMVIEEEDGNEVLDIP